MANRRVEIDELDEGPVTWSRVASRYQVFCQLQHSSDRISLGNGHYANLKSAFSPV